MDTSVTLHVNQQADAWDQWYNQSRGHTTL